MSCFFVKRLEAKDIFIYQKVIRKEEEEQNLFIRRKSFSKILIINFSILLAFKYK